MRRLLYLMMGGRYSVLTAVGLLPIATAGINIESIMIGAAKAREELSSDDLDQNIAYQYATIRNILYSKGYTTEMLINYEPYAVFQRMVETIIR